MNNAIPQISHERHHIYVPRDLAARAADVITAFVGSWAFVGIHTVWFVFWIVLRIEAFPYGLLTLLVSLEAIFLSTFVMMSQNRSAEKDHLRDDHEAEEVDLLFKINQQQLEILHLLRTEICVPNGAKSAVAADGARPAVPATTLRPSSAPVSASARPSAPTSSRRRRR